LFGVYLLAGCHTGHPITWEEAEPIMHEMSSLIYQAKELHYDSATMLMKLKAEMQVL
jgi:alpha-1,4-galacturonosyltransferase